ncbi:OLC1v1038350C1 [Oldenlandia corymbosa var. corymbosa]|uniref:OLC1v1038350C1 n=1 Tax=Oldenlandia corymbosa var. corymbosa TaxID=529605 RepID=A0AAV1D1V8_OLDCO|nr:OLC1v1038350C1 [Oldenlandia corymbosa var. corymbosa]
MSPFKPQSQLPAPVPKLNDNLDVKKVMHGLRSLNLNNGDVVPMEIDKNLSVDIGVNVNPPYMNTIGLPPGGCAAIRFTADNTWVWFMYCHLEMHSSWGLAVVFILRNGKGPHQTLPHPPADLPTC